MIYLYKFQIPIAISFCLFLCLGCNSFTPDVIVSPTIQSTHTPKPTPPEITFPLSQPTPPPFLAEIFPAPDSQTSKLIYEADLMNEYGIDGYEGTRDVEGWGYRSNICVYLDATYIDIWPETLQSGKEYCEYPPFTELTGYCYLSKRTTLIVDEVELIPVLDTNWFPVGLVGTRGRPHWLCWPAKLDIGLHKATFMIQPDSGSQREYSWNFAITD
ncbi:MAG: hypothetical protein AB8G95_09945 [Anaerolineae bacterium]